jgi:hypothetical protein
LTLYELHLYFFTICTFHPHLLIKIWHSREPFPTVFVSKKMLLAWVTIFIVHI